MGVSRRCRDRRRRTEVVEAWVGTADLVGEDTLVEEEIRIVAVGLVHEEGGMAFRNGTEGLVVCRVGSGGGARGCLRVLVLAGVGDEEGRIEQSLRHQTPKRVV